jgi:hypothetical protein
MDGTYDDLGQTVTNTEDSNSFKVIPDNIYYIKEHRVAPISSRGLTHEFIIDGDLSQSGGNTLKSFRVMKPAEVCFHNKTPNAIQFYTLSGETTKKPRKDEMYSKVVGVNDNSAMAIDGSSSNVIIEESTGHRDTQADYNDTVLSMYVIVDPDGVGFTSGTKSKNYVIRDADKFFSNGFAEGDYTFYMTDGTTKYTNSINYTKGDNAPLITFNSPLRKQYGIVSLSTPFTIETSNKVKLKKAQSARIGASVSITLEAEGIINDILEKQNIEFTNTTETYPYFIGPNFQGADVYSAINFLSRFKRKRLDFHNDTISLSDVKAEENYTGVFITDMNVDYKIISVSKEKSLFDYYNEVIVYGRGVKSKVRDVRGIKKFGTKTLEVTDESFITEEETNSEARRLLKQHNNDESQRVTVKLSGTKLKYLRVGDIVSFESKTNGISRNDYMVLGITHNMSGLLELELGVNNAGLDAKLAEILIDNKKSNAFIRGQNFKENEESAMHLIAFGLKGRKLRIRKTTSSGAFKLGFTVALNTNTSGFTLGFSGGSSSTTTLEEITL